MAVRLASMGLTKSKPARARASGVGLFAAQSFHKGDMGSGFGAPAAVSGLLVFIIIVKLILLCCEYTK